MGIFARKKATDRSSIPNPTKELPPSKSSLHVFKKAAVCADGPPCAEIGRSVTNSLAVINFFLPKLGQKVF